MKSKNSTRYPSFGGAVCAGVLLLMASSAMGQNLFVSENNAGGNVYSYTPGAVQSTVGSGLDFPYGLAVDSAGNLFVANNDDDGNGGSVIEIAPGGAQTPIPSGPDPKALAFDRAGDLFETDYHSGNIYEYSTGGVLSVFATVTPAPQALAFDSAGNLFVGTGFGGGNESITKITPDGTQSTFATGLSYIGGLAFNSAGDLFEADNGTAIYEFAPDGTPSTFASGLSNLGQLAFDNAGNLYVADSGTEDIYEYTPDGTQSTFTSGLNGPVGLAFQGIALPVPEPSVTGLMAASAAIGFAWRRARKARRA